MNEEKFQKWLATQSLPTWSSRADVERWFREQCRHGIGSIVFKESSPCGTCADCGEAIAVHDTNVAGFIRALVLECKDLRARLDSFESGEDIYGCRKNEKVDR